MRLADFAQKLGGVQWSGDTNFVARCPAHDDNDPSLSVSVGDDGRLLVHCFAGCEAGAIVDRVGLTLGDLMPPRLTLAASNGRVAPHVRIWREAMVAAGTLAESYLRNRAITIPVPPSLKFHPQLIYQDEGARQELPALIAPIQIETQLIGVHRTYLAPDGLAKAAIAKPKKMLGSAKGGAVRLAPIAERLGVAEGIETALSVMQADGLPVWATLSAEGLRAFTCPPTVKEVVIYADHDPIDPRQNIRPGTKAAEALAARLALSNIRVGIKMPATEGSDFNDLLQDEGERAIRETPVQWWDVNKQTGLPTIDADIGNLESAHAEVISAIKRWNDPPQMFIHETTGKIVKLVWRAPKNDQETSAHLVLSEVSIDDYQNVLAGAAHWVRFTRRGPEEVFPPYRLVRASYAKAHEARFLPLLRAVVYSPTFAPSGRLLRPGYDAETHLWYAADPDDPVEEDEEEVSDAKKLLEEALHDFCFETEGDRAHAVSLFLLPFVREMIDGPVPLYNIEAPIAGTGKGLLARVLLSPSRSYRLIPETTREDEQEKQIDTVCINSWPAAVIDNVSNTVKSPRLASIVTSKNPEVRLMGSNHKIVRIMRVPIFVITANNPTFSEENARRVARIRIISPIERPSERNGFRHPRLELWLEESRTALCRAAITMIRSWLAAGSPSHADKPWGSFERWGDIMSGLVSFLGYEGFGTARIEQEAVDSAETRWRVLVEKWAETFKTQPVFASDIVILADAIDGFFTEREAKSSKPRVVAKGLGFRRDRIFGTWRVELGPQRRGQRQWRLANMALD